MLPIDYILLIIGILLVLSIIASRVSARFGVPTLLIFLGIGMLAGTEGPGGILFESAPLAQSFGIVALIFILFAGGLGTDWQNIKGVVKQGIALSTLGVVFSTFLVGLFSYYILNLSWLEGLLLGAIMSSTDAAAVFSIFRSKKLHLKNNLTELLEFESGSNDPMAVFLTLTFTSLIIQPESSAYQFIPLFFLNMGIGVAVGFIMAKIVVHLLNSVKLPHEALFSPLLIGMIIATYSITSLLKGNGFLAVYISAMIIGNSNLIFKNSLKQFVSSLTWLFEIIMFLTLGLLVSPTHIVPVIGVGLIMALFLMFVARPISVFLSLILSRLNFREKLMISWTGLRGATPIILVTFPLLAGVPRSEIFFNVIFFIVITSALLQGTLMTQVAKLLKLDMPFQQRRVHHLELGVIDKDNTRLEEFLIPYNSQNIGKTISELPWPEDTLVMLICRDEKYFVPRGSTYIEEGDVLLVVIKESNAKTISEILSS